MGEPAINPNLSFLCLNTLIRERKAEVKQRAQLARLKNLQRIQEQCSLSGSNNSTGVNAVIILPAELWENVFDYLKDTVDLENAWKTCPLFRNILDNRRINEILFPMVYLGALKIAKFQDYLRPPAEKKTQAECKLKHVLELRYLCKSWQSAVDRILEINLEPWQYDHTSLEEDEWDRRRRNQALHTG